MSPRFDIRAVRSRFVRRACHLLAILLLVLGLGILVFALVPAIAQRDGADTTVTTIDEAADHAGRDHATDEHAAAASPAKSKIAGTLCLVCKKPVNLDDITLTFRGRHIHLHAGRCLELWNAAKEKFFATLQPRGALFQEDGTAVAPRLAGGWMFFGLYVVVGLLFGGATALFAIRRGLPAVPWFAAGLATNVIGFAVLMTRRGVEPATPVIDVPVGLTRPADTHQPIRCPECAASVHPAAGECGDCGTTLVPKIESETRRA